MTQCEKSLPAMQETQETRIRSLEEETATHSSILAWKKKKKFHAQRSLAAYSPKGQKELDLTEQARIQWEQIFLPCSQT